MRKAGRLASLLLTLMVHNAIIAQRNIISLNGAWQIAKTDVQSAMPSVYTSTIPVPGLVDMAVAAVEEPYTGALDKDKNNPFANNYGNKSYLYNNALYWYKCSFVLKNNSADVIQLKLNKAVFQTHVYLNGKLVGQNSYSFTPTYVNIKSFLNAAGLANELVISVGCRNNLPDNVCRADDGEKVLFPPGIYDDVKIIMSGSPFITNVQTAPDVKSQQIRVIAEINNDRHKPYSLAYLVRETVSKKIVTRGVANTTSTSIVDFNIPLPNCRLWSPEIRFYTHLNYQRLPTNWIPVLGCVLSDQIKKTAWYCSMKSPTTCVVPPSMVIVPSASVASLLMEGVSLYWPTS